MNWQWLHFNELSAQEIYEILAVRQEVFVVEQSCIYRDADNLDIISYHLTGRADNQEIGAYARIIPPGSRFDEPSIGRLLTRKKYRHQGLARKILDIAVKKCRETFPGHDIRISAQIYLTRFYTEMGFKEVGQPYDEDGIEHREMILEKIS